MSFMRARITSDNGREFAAHESVNHSAYEWVRGDVHSNTVENYFSVFKRGMRGTYQHCSEAHLQRYLYELRDRRYISPDDAELLVRGGLGDLNPFFPSRNRRTLLYRPPLEHVRRVQPQDVD